jgi:hypothetical protein
MQNNHYHKRKIRGSTPYNEMVEEFPNRATPDNDLNVVVKIIKHKAENSIRISDPTPRSADEAR